MSTDAGCAACRRVEATAVSCEEHTQQELVYQVESILQSKGLLTAKKNV